MRIVTTYAEFENDNDGEDGPDGILAQLFLLYVNEQRNHCQRQSRLRRKHHFPSIRSRHIPKLPKKLHKPIAEPNHAIRECVTRNAAVAAATVAVQPQLWKILPGEKPLLAPLRKYLPQRNVSRRHQHSSLSSSSPLRHRLRHRLSKQSVVFVSECREKREDKRKTERKKQMWALCFFVTVQMHNNIILLFLFLLFLVLFLFGGISNC